MKGWYDYEDTIINLDMVEFIMISGDKSPQNLPPQTIRFFFNAERNVDITFKTNSKFVVEKVHLFTKLLSPPL